MMSEAWLPRIEARLASQLRFLVEADRLKSVIRGNRIADGFRRENTAEHFWHLASYALVLRELAGGVIDLWRVVQMLIFHDWVGIECGDTRLWDKQGVKVQREQRAAVKVLGLLPPDQAETLHAMWAEFDAATTDEARFARAFDRFQPIPQNDLVGGGC